MTPSVPHIFADGVSGDTDGLQALFLNEPFTFDDDLLAANRDQRRYDFKRPCQIIINRYPIWTNIRYVCLAQSTITYVGPGVLDPGLLFQPLYGGPISLSAVTFSD